MDKIKFVDGKSFDISSASSTGITFNTTIADFAVIHDEFTKSNMREMDILDSTGKTVLSTMKNYKPIGTAQLTDADSGVEITVAIAAMSDLEVAAFENSEAIAELAALVAAGTTTE